ncbi:MAG TPA: hypothetical protein ENN80_00090 [Candidatus Hydrogenedentes bacterium]|nr:hypothetical protein [Candidatus Hydrogenedentota bacterium]
MSSPRIKRLKADHEEVLARFSNNPFIHLHTVRGNPPQRYEFGFNVKGLELLDDGRIVERSDHVAEVSLSSGYPRQAPQCKMLTPIFHPNIDTAAICIGDHWAASESLADLVCRIGEIITFQSYNTRSPLNGEAARWADENQGLLPIDRVDFYPVDADEQPAAPVVLRSATPPPLPERVCSSCGASSPEHPLVQVASGESYCSNCVVTCPACGTKRFHGVVECPRCVMEVHKALSQVNALARAGDLKQALRRLEALLAQRPNDPKLLAARRTIVTRLQEAKPLSDAAKAAYQQHHFIEFLEGYARIQRLGVAKPEWEEHLQHAHKRVAHAREAMRLSASVRDSDPEKARMYLAKALRLSADCPGAQQELDRLGQRLLEQEKAKQDSAHQAEEGRQPDDPFSNLGVAWESHDG